MREEKEREDAAEDAGREVDGACDQQLEFLSLHRCGCSSPLVMPSFFAKKLTFRSSLWEWRVRIKGRNVNVLGVAQINLRMPRVVCTLAARCRRE